jgi:hypothetical protein
MKERKNTAVWCAVIAVALAVIMLAVTGFGAFRLLRGAEAVADGKDLEAGAYVKADLTHVMDVVGVEKNASGAETAYYAVSPVGDTFVLVRFPASDAENMMALEKATEAYLRGESSELPFRLGVVGAVREMDEDTAELLARWFNENADWMRQAGVITEVEDYGTYLSGRMIESGRVANVSVPLAAAAGIAAALLTAGAVAVFILAGTGRLDRPAGKREDKDV